MNLALVALKNLTRKRVRSIAIMLAAFLASALIFGGTAVFYSMARSVENGIQKLGADIMVVPAEHEEAGRSILLSAVPAAFYMDGRNLDSVRTVQGVEIASPQIFVTSTKFQCCGMPTALIVGFDMKTDFTLSPWVIAQYPPWKGHENLDPVTVGMRLAMTPNKDLKFYGKQFRLGYLLAGTGSVLIDNSIFMPIEVIRDMVLVSQEKSQQPLKIAPGEISAVLVKVRKDADSHKVAKDIETALPATKAIITRDLLQQVRREVEVAIWGTWALGFLCWVMMLVLMGLVFAMTVNERARELGILRAMGASKFHVFSLLLTEAIMLSGMGAVVGVGLCTGLIRNFRLLIIKYLGNIDFMWMSPSVMFLLGLICVSFIVVSGALSALYPAIRTCMKEPYDAIHKGM
jgi:putative ABC transport system permease protein